MAFSVKKAQSVLRLMTNRYLTGEQFDRAADEIAESVHRSVLATGEVRQ